MIVLLTFVDTDHAEKREERREERRSDGECFIEFQLILSINTITIAIIVVLSGVIHYISNSNYFQSNYYQLLWIINNLSEVLYHKQLPNIQ